MTPDALRGRNVFGTVSAGKLRFNTGSHIDVEGYNLISGFSGLRRMDSGELSGGAFFEYGQGDYDSTNSFPSGRIKGSGRTEYTGLGALIRFDTTNGTYLDAFLRGGRTETTYRSDDLRDASGRRVEYDVDGAYYGFHLGVGKRIALNAASSLDLSTRLLWTHQNGVNATLSTGERIEFESINSTRLRLGARYTHTLSERLAAYAGVGVDHEFDSRARATLNDFKVDAPDMRGTTGQTELGLRFVSEENGPLTMETGIQGHAGKREGVTANFRLHYKF
jgi:outer membrane autotransporter protein